MQVHKRLWQPGMAAQSPHFTPAVAHQQVPHSGTRGRPPTYRKQCVVLPRQHIDLVPHDAANRREQTKRHASDQSNCVAAGQCVDDGLHRGRAESERACIEGLASRCYRMIGTDGVHRLVRKVGIEWLTRSMCGTNGFHCASPGLVANRV